MNWPQMLQELSALELTDAELLSAALTARGRIAMDGGSAHALDDTLRRAGNDRLREAALFPGLAAIEASLTEAEGFIDALDQPAALQAEENIARALDDLDLWWVRAAALESLGLGDLAQEVRRERDQALVTVEKHEAALDAVGWMAESRRSESANAEQTAWKLAEGEEGLAKGESLPRPGSTPPHVPGLGSTPPPSPRPEGSGELEELLALDARLKESELIEVAHGEANAVVESRVARGLERDPELRRRYEPHLAAAAAADAPPALTVIPGGAQRRPVKAEPLPLRMAASDDHPRYQRPPPEARIAQFDDGAELYAVAEGRGWVLLLYRVQVDEANDRFEPERVKETWSDGRLLVARMSPGKVTLRYLGQAHTFELGDPSDAPG